MGWEGQLSKLAGNVSWLSACISHVLQLGTPVEAELEQAVFGPAFHPYHMTRLYLLGNHRFLLAFAVIYVTTGTACQSADRRPFSTAREAADGCSA